MGVEVIDGFVAIWQGQLKWLYVRRWKWGRVGWEKDSVERIIMFAVLRKILFAAMMCSECKTSTTEAREVRETRRGHENKWEINLLEWRKRMNSCGVTVGNNSVE